MMQQNPVQRPVGRTVLNTLMASLSVRTDMTQLALGLDRDSGVVSALFDERNDAVKALLSMEIRAAKQQGKYVGVRPGSGSPEDFAAYACRWKKGSTVCR